MKIKILFSLFFVQIICANCYLFQEFPNLLNVLPYESFCELPTPITKLEKFGQIVGFSNVYLKRDDLTGKRLNDNTKLYGGNKARKLEFLLADALKKGASTVMTYGCAGSNHALATSFYAKELGLKSILMLRDQPNSSVVRQNLTLDFLNNSKINFYENSQARDIATEEILENNSDVYFFPTGGSNKIGALGFVNAFLELYEQIQDGVIKTPDFIYVPTGSYGTVSGLLLGLALKKLETKIIAVAVEPEEENDQIINGVKRLFKECNEYLNSLDKSVPLVEFPEDNFIINKKFCGQEYGLWTQESYLAIKLFKELENINLEGTYSSKQVNAFLDDLINKKLKDETVLIWNTYCGLDFSKKTNSANYKKLPEHCHKYFEEDVQLINKFI